MVGYGRFKYLSSAHAWLEDVSSVLTNNLLILGLVGLGEALETMVELCLWAIYHILCKIYLFK